MIEPVRPRPITVIAVIWLYVGASWTLSALALLVGMSALSSLSGASRDLAWLGVMPWFCAGLAFSGVTGTIGAQQILGLRSRGRVLLEIASWAAFATIALFMLSVAHALAFTPGYFGGETLYLTRGDRGLPPLLAGIVLGAPFVVLARKLRTDEVRYAIRDAEMRRG